MTNRFRDKNGGPIILLGRQGKISLKEDEITDIIEIDRRNLGNFDIAFDHREILEEFFGLR